MGCSMTCNLVWWGPLEAAGDSTQANCGFLVLQKNSCVANYNLEISNLICFQVAFIILKFCYFVSLCAENSISGAGQCNLPQHFHVDLVSAVVSFETQLLMSPLSHKIYKRSCFSRWDERLAKQLHIVHHHKIPQNLLCCHTLSLVGQFAGVDPAVDIDCQFLWRRYLCSFLNISSLQLFLLRSHTYVQGIWAASMFLWFQSFIQCCLFTPNSAVLPHCLAEGHFPAEATNILPSSSPAKVTSHSNAGNEGLSTLKGAWRNWIMTVIEKDLSLEGGCMAVSGFQT